MVIERTVCQSNEDCMPIERGLYAKRTRTACQYEAAGLRFLVELLKLFNIVCNTETIPNDWQKGIICLIWKTGDKIDCRITEGLHCCHMWGNYTGQLLRTDYERMLKASLESGSRD